MFSFFNIFVYYIIYFTITILQRLKLIIFIYIRNIRKIVKKYNLDPICFHELRHTCASLLINSGIDPKTVSKRLGHADVSITIEIYTHSFEASKIACANKFDEIMASKMLKNTHGTNYRHFQ